MPMVYKNVHTISINQRNATFGVPGAGVEASIGSGRLYSILPGTGTVRDPAGAGGRRPVGWLPAAAPQHNGSPAS